MYLALEGVKGTGKSTVMTHLNALLNGNNQPFELITPTRPMPKNNPWEQASTALQDDDLFKEALYATRSNHHACQIDWYALAHHLLLSDRSIFTSMMVRLDNATQSDMSLACYFRHLRQKEWAIGIPDVVVQLIASETVLLQRYQNRNRNYGRGEENLATIQKFEQNYRHIAEWLTTEQAYAVLGKSVRWVQMDNEGDAIQTAQRIFAMAFDNTPNYG